MSIRQRLLQVEDDFLAAVSNGSLESFHDEHWAPLTQDIENAILSSKLDEDTILLAHVTSSRIAILADTFQELDASRQRLTSHVMTEVDAILSQLTIEDPPRMCYARDSSPPLRYAVGHAVFPFEHQSEIHYQHVTKHYDSSLVSHFSPTPSLVSLSTADDSDEDTVPIPVIGRKRNADTMDNSPSGTVPSERIIKRLRISHIEDDPQSVVSGWSIDPLCLPQTPPSDLYPAIKNSIGGFTDGPLERKDDILYPGRYSRKRRLSDADADVHSAPKRPRGLPVGPRLHAVSDPLPVGSAPTAAGPLGGLFEINLETLDTPSLSWGSWGEVGYSGPVQVDFFDDWASIGVATIDSYSLQPLEAGKSEIAQLLAVNHDVQPIVSSPCDASSSSCSYDTLRGTISESPLINIAAVPSAVLKHTELPASSKEGMIQSATPTPSTDDAVCAPTPLSTAVLAPPSYQLDLPNVSSVSTQPDVLSLYTTLCDTDPAPISVICEDISQSVLDLSLPSPPTFSEDVAIEEDWTQLLASLDQRAEIVLPTPPPPYDPSTEMTRLLESFLQPVDVASYCPQVVSDKDKKLKELEAAKEAVRRLEAEVSATA